MNKKLLALLFAVPGFGLAQTTYGVLGFAKQIGEVAVASENDGTHDFSIALGRDQGWYAHAKENNVGISRKNETKFRLVKTDKENVFKLYCVNNQKFVAYKDDREGENKTKFVVSKTILIGMLSLIWVKAAVKTSSIFCPALLTQTTRIVKVGMFTEVLMVETE